MIIPGLADRKSQTIRDKKGATKQITFSGVLQHLPTDIAGQFKGAVILCQLNQHNEKEDMVELSSLACDSKLVVITIGVM